MYAAKGSSLLCHLLQLYIQKECQKSHLYQIYRKSNFYQTQVPSLFCPFSHPLTQLEIFTLICHSCQSFNKDLSNLLQVFVKFVAHICRPLPNHSPSSPEVALVVIITNFAAIRKWSFGKCWQDCAVDRAKKIKFGNS